MTPSDSLPVKAGQGTLAIIGVGLVGGSFAAALRASGHVGRVLGVDADVEALNRAIALGLIDTSADLARAAQADLIMVATPVRAMSDVMAQLAPHLAAHSVITDAGSTKVDVIAAAREGLGDRIDQFVPGHPIAGGERAGPDAAHAALYRGRQVILSPLPENNAASVQRVREAWEACGAQVCEMTASEHDAVFASVSHLPHLLAAVYMATIVQADNSTLRLRCAGTGFRDFTRIAAGSAEVWRDIFLSNATPLRLELQSLRQLLDAVDRALEQGDGSALESLLDVAAEARRAWPPGSSS